MLALQPLVLAADLAAAAHDAAGERQDDAGHLPDGRDRRLGRREGRGLASSPRIRKLPPADALDRAERRPRRGTRRPSPAAASSAGRRASC